MTIGDFLVKITGDNSGLTRSLDSAKSKLLSFGTFVSGVVAGYSAKKLFDFTVGGDAQFEQYQTSFEVLMGSADTARQHMQYLFDFAATTPFEMPQIVEASKLLETFGLDTKKYLTQVGNTASAFNVPLTQVADAIGRLAAGQTGEAMEQLRRLGISQKQLLEQGITFDKGGELTSSVQKTMDAVMNIMDTKYKGMMDKQSQTFNGLWSTLKDNLGAFGRDVGGKTFDMLKGKLQEFTAQWAEWGKDGTLDNMAGKLGTFLATTVDGLSKGIDFVVRYGKEIIGLIIAFQTFITVLKGINAVLLAVSAIKSYTEAVRAAAAAQTLFNTVAMTNPIVAIIAALLTLGFTIGAYTLATNAMNSVTYDAKQAILEKRDADLKEVDSVKSLYKEYENLNGKTNKTTEEKNRLKFVVEEINKILPGTIQIIDAETSAYKTQGVEIDKLVAKKSALVKVDSLESLAKDAHKEIYRLTTENEKTQGDIAGWENKKNSVPRPQGMSSTSASTISNANQEIGKLNGKMAENNKEIEKQQKVLKDFESANKEFSLQYGSKETAPPKSYTPLSDTSKDTKTVKYENKPLENYIKMVEHKKKMEQETTAQEINDYKYALSALAKTQEEKWDLLERIHDAEKRMNEEKKQDMDKYTDTYISDVDKRVKAGNRSIEEAINDYQWLAANENLTAEQREKVEKALYDMKQQRFQNSVSWINQESQLGRLSTKEQIEAWTRVYNNQKDNIDAVKEATLNLYRLRKQLIEDEAKVADDNSQKWLEREKLYGRLNEVDEIAGYNRIIERHKKTQDNIVNNEEYTQAEKEKLWLEEENFIREQEDKIFSIKKASVEKQINNYIDSEKKRLDIAEDTANKELQAKLKAIDAEYSAIEDKEKSAERSKNLIELKKQEQFMQYAVTKEGKAKLKEIQDKIAQIEKDEAKDARDKEKETRKASIQQEIDDNEVKYTKMKEDLETKKNEMLAASAQFANQTKMDFTIARESFADGFTGLMTDMVKNLEVVKNKGLSYINEFVKAYKQAGLSLNNTNDILNLGKGPLSQQSADNELSQNGSSTKKITFNQTNNNYINDDVDVDILSRSVTTGTGRILGGF